MEVASISAEAWGLLSKVDDALVELRYYYNGIEELNIDETQDNCYSATCWGRLNMQATRIGGINKA